MKKILQRVLGIVISIISFSYNFCYADEIDPIIKYSSDPFPLELAKEVNIFPIIIIGSIVAIIVTVAIITLVKSNKKNEKNNEEKKK